MVLLSFASTACGSSTATGAPNGGIAGDDGVGGVESGRPAACDGTVCNGSCLKQIGNAKSGCTLFANLQAQSLALSGNYLYFTDADAVGRVSTTSREVSTLHAPAEDPGHVVVAGDFLYFSEPSGKNAAVLRMPLAGGPPSPVTDGFDFVNELLVSDSTVYVEGDSMVNEYMLRSAPAAGGPAVLALANTVEAFTVDSSSIYSVPYSATRGFMATVTANLIGMPDGGTAIAGLDTSADALIAADTLLYYCGTHAQTLGGSCGSIGRIDGAVTVLADSDSRLVLKAVDGAGLLLLETGLSGDRLLEVPLGGGTPRVLATLEDVGDFPVASDSAHVYVGALDAVLAVDR